MTFKFCGHEGPNGTNCNRLAGHKGDHTYVEPIVEQPATYVVYDQLTGKYLTADPVDHDEAVRVSAQHALVEIRRADEVALGFYDK